MAKLTAPLMSFGASGKLGNSLVYSQWKGIPTARQYVTPANPQTVAQTAQRSLLASVVSIWRSTKIDTVVRTAWNLLASTRGLQMSGFNVFTSQICQLVAEVPAASICSAVTDDVANAVILTMKNADDLADGDEAGDFTILFGAAPDQLLYSKAGAIVSGELTFNATEAGLAATDTVYCIVRKSGTGTTTYDRSGILAITLT